MNTQLSSLARVTSLTALGAFVFIARAPAQIPVYQFQGTTGDQFGSSVRSVGDVNGDGFADIVVGAPFASPHGANSGRISIYSGVDGTLIRTIDGTSAGAQFGYAVAAIGDLDHDGVPDFAVGAPRESAGATPVVGALWIFSGATGATIAHVVGSKTNAQFGSALASLGDVDLDGSPDIAVASPAYTTASQFNVGRVDVFSGATLAILQSYVGVTSGAHFGTSIAAAGDLDQDGVSDLIVGAPGISSSFGHVFVYSGRTQAQIRAVSGQSNGDQFGFAVAGGRDLDHDGVPDFVVGAPFDSTHGASSGSIAAFSGANGAPMYVAHGSAGDYFGYALALCGDVDGDGFAELVAASPLAGVGGSAQTGSVVVLSGPLMKPIASCHGASGEELGIALAVGDTNGDGFEDLLLGAPLASPNGTSSGYVEVVYLGCPLPTNYCTAKQTSTGCLPSISSIGIPFAITGSDDFEISASQLIDGKYGLLFWGTHAANIPFGGGTLCVAPPVVRTAIQNAGCSSCAACQGAIHFAFSKSYMSAESLHGGDTIYAQFWGRDPGFHGAQNISLTDALRFTICN